MQCWQVLYQMTKILTKSKVVEVAQETKVSQSKLSSDKP